jgi:hypothetical protein
MNGAHVAAIDTGKARRAWWRACEWDGRGSAVVLGSDRTSWRRVGSLGQESRQCNLDTLKSRSSVGKDLRRRAQPLRTG